MIAKQYLLKSVGVVFLEEMDTDKDDSTERLAFDQVACAHLLLQLNKLQSLFDFQIITLDKEDRFCFPKERLTPQHFDKQIFQMIQNGNQKFQGIDYWIGITSKPIVEDFFFLAPESGGEFGKLSQKVSIITSERWDKDYSPPSLFEYITLTVLICSLYHLSYDLLPKFKPHKTKSCVFDFTNDKAQRRILVSNPLICNICKRIMMEIENKMQNKPAMQITEQIDNILKRKWMGSPEKRDTPFYNLKKLYKYDVDRNSGYYKNTREKLRDIIVDKLPDWTIGNVAAGVIGGAIALLFVLLFGNKH